VVKAYYDALNEQQIDEAMGYIADDASFVNPTGTYRGKDEIQASLEGLAGAGITFELSAFKDEGGRVTYDYKVLQDGQLLDQGPGGLTIVEDGKIVFDGTEDTEPN
jgi:ketosteroid isomerase-like protein